jgi:hypothetical protein
MTAHLIRITAATALILLITLLPFIPGRYDPLAVPLSGIARVLGYTALLLVPVGILWALFAGRRRSSTLDYRFAVTAWIAGVLISAAGALIAAAAGGFTLGVVVLAAAGYAIVRLKRLIATVRTTPASTIAIVLYLVVAPLAVFLLQRTLIEPAVESSRERAIRSATPLIADIERYREERGRYPVSLLSVWEDYSPSVIGIERFHYEPSGDAYNLLFEQPAADLATREIVVYNPRGEQVATSHRLDLLQYPPERLERTRGFFAAYETSHPKWKYFWFD